MANTERLNTLQYVINAMEQVKTKQDRIDDPTSSEYQALQRAYIQLSAAHDDLVYEDMKQVVNDIANAAKELNRIVKKMNEDLDGLKTVAKTIDKAATALGVLAEIVAMAVG